jgi:8-oxo-dGTP pyrophosphatase MutT (NUDIX family)/phosphohistidine phosphatase SixA
MTIYAAGALLWREVEGKLLVAVIHRARYDDWSFPKGKQDPGEVLPETAVREIREETGLKIKLGVRLKIVSYTVGDNVPKEVHYWAARVSDSALANSKFEPSEEVASVEWKSPEEVRSLLTYDFDREVLDRALDLHILGHLKTKPIIVLRHATATPRTDWKGGKAVDDGHRPLLEIGHVEAKQLVPLLSAFAPRRLVTSSWVRCQTTLEPFAKAKKLKLIERHQLSEFGNKTGPRRTLKVVHDLVTDGSPAVICSHRPALPTILEALSEYGSVHHKPVLEESAALQPAHMTVVHLTPKVEGKKRTIVSIETYAPAAPLPATPKKPAKATNPAKATKPAKATNPAKAMKTPKPAPGNKKPK